MARLLCEDKSRSMVPSGGFCYSDGSSGNQTQLVNQIHGFDSNPEIFSLATSMEMIGFSKNPQQNCGAWKGFFGKPPNQTCASSSKAIDPSTSGDYYHHHLAKPDFPETATENLMVTPDTVTWQESRLLVDESLRCVFPCEGNERPSQGLSLSLSSAHPSSIGLQTFELRQAAQNREDRRDDTRFGVFGKTPGIHHQQEQLLQDGFSGKSGNIYHHAHFQLRNSRYLGPAQELLNEFCSLGIKQGDPLPPKPRLHNKAKQCEEEEGKRKQQSVYSLDFMELQKRKAKLLSMLEQVEKRYRQYRDQMKAVASSFEAVAGDGAAKVYSAEASKAMSRHFRSLRDGIVGQIRATKKALGEKHQVAPGTSRGETPRLRLLDQALRQQKAFQQMSMIETHPWRPQRGLPERSVSILRSWLFEHFLHPYPTDVDKHILARQTGLSRSQVSNWFINARVRLWKPMVEEMYLEETKDQESNALSEVGTDDDGEPHLIQNQNQLDQKPTQEQLVRMDSESLSSIITNPEKGDDKNGRHAFHHMQQHPGEAFGATELDFSIYNHHSVAGAMPTYSNDDANHGFGIGGGGVSLTLGLQQHGAAGMSLAFSPASQGSLFYSRDGAAVEDGGQPVHDQYSLIDEEAHHHVPYRNLMEAQLLHDLAG